MAIDSTWCREPRLALSSPNSEPRPRNDKDGQAPTRWRQVARLPVAALRRSRRAFGTFKAREPNVAQTRLIYVRPMSARRSSRPPPSASDLGANEPVMRQSDTRSFGIHLQPLLPGAYGLAYSMLGERGAAEDAVQEAATKAWRGLRRLRKGASLQAWFLTIVANQCRDARRRSRRTDMSLFEVPEPKVADHADLVARDIDLESALARLSPRQRGLLFLRYQMDMPPAEIAEILGLRTGTVKSRLHRTLRKLEADMVAATEENS